MLRPRTVALTGAALVVSEAQNFNYRAAGDALGIDRVSQYEQFAAILGVSAGDGTSC